MNVSVEIGELNLADDHSIHHIVKEGIPRAHENGEVAVLNEYQLPPMQLSDTKKKRLQKRIERGKMHSKVPEVDDFNDPYPSYGKSRITL